MKLLNIESLPPHIALGQQTETGVLCVGFNCSEWLRVWPSLTLSVWVKRPGEDAAYPAVTRMDEDVLVWDVNGTDTAIAGWGSVEIMGKADGVKKLSITTGVLVHASITGATTEPPEAARPWVDQVLSAATRAEEAAKRAEESKAKAAKISTMTLLAEAWTGASNLYSQTVTIEGVTENSQVDITPSVEQLVTFYEKDIAFVTENEGGLVTVYAIGQKPTNDYVLQVTITEVDV